MLQSSPARDEPYAFYEGMDPMQLMHEIEYEEKHEEEQRYQGIMEDDTEVCIIWNSSHVGREKLSSCNQPYVAQ